MTKKEQIIEKAIILFSQKGYASTSIVDLSVAVGLSPSAGGIYRHFKNKEAILKAILGQRSQILNELDKKLANQDLNAPRSQFIDSFCRFSLDAAYNLRDYYRVIVNEVPKFPELKILIDHEGKVQGVERFSALLNSLLQREVNNADFRALGHIYWDAITQRSMNAPELNRLSDKNFIKGWAKIIEEALMRAENIS